MTHDSIHLLTKDIRLAQFDDFEVIKEKKKKMEVIGKSGRVTNVVGS
jgi:hypothetical protein